MATQTKEVLPYSADYLLSRYYLTDVTTERMSVDIYREILREGLILMKDMKQNSLEDIYQIVQVFKELGLSTMSESSKFYVDFVDNKPKAAFKVTDGIFDFFRLRYTLVSLDYKNYNRDKLIEMLVFFRYINEGVKDITDSNIEEIFNFKNYYSDLKAVSVKETKFNYSSSALIDYEKDRKTLSESFSKITSSKAGISVRTGRMFKNSYGNIFRALKIILRGKAGNSEFIVYIPAMIEGVYSLGNNKFVKTHYYEHYAKGRYTNLITKIVRSIVDSSLSITKAYYINKQNAVMIRHLLQTAINNMLYSKKTIRLSKAEIKMLHKQGVWVDPDTAWQNDYEVQPFTMISNQKESLTPFEIFMEHHKFYFREYPFVKRSSAKNILDNIGKEGYETYRYLPLNDETLRKFDPTFINSKANYLVAWTNDEKKSIIEMIDKTARFNYKSFRNAASSHVVGHAFRLKGIKEHELIENIPAYHAYFAIMDYVDDEGLSTFDGQRLMSTKTNISDGLYEGIKLSFNALDKGICRMTKDNIYAIVNGKKEYLNLTSGQSFASRLNFGPLVQGLLRTKGNDVEDVENITLDDLQESLEVFKETEDGDISLGFRQVALMTSFFVHEIDSSYKNEDLQEAVFKKYKLGSEWMQRARLLGAKRMIKYLLGSFEKQQENIFKILSTDTGKAHGKKGSIVQKVYQKELIGFTSTVTANTSLAPDEARIYLKDDEFEAFIKGIMKIEKNFDLFGARANFYSGRFIELPPSLQLRNPSIDNANTIYMRTFLRRATGKYVKHGYSEVNPKTWSRQGGDFDGDQVIFLFFKFYLRKEMKQIFGYKNHEYVDTFEYKLRNTYDPSLSGTFAMANKEMFNSNFGETKTLEAFIDHIAGLKDKDSQEIKDMLLDGRRLKPMTLKQMLLSASRNVFTTRVSKQLIGVSKTVTMTSLAYISNAIERYNDALDEDTIQKLNQSLMDNADNMNYELVQPTIDIQKWSDDLRQVVRTLLIVFRMSEAISFLVENRFYPKKMTQRLIIEAMKSEKDYHEFLLSLTDTTLFDDKDYRFNYQDAGWYLDDPEKDIKDMISVIDVNGEVYKEIVKSVEKDLEGKDIDKMFNTITK